MGQVLTVAPSQPEHAQVVTLGQGEDAVQYRFRLIWRERPRGWYADLWEADGTPVYLGVRLAPGWPLGAGLRPTNRPAGPLYVRGPAGYDREDLGDTLFVVYYAPDELEPEEPTGPALTVTV